MGIYETTITEAFLKGRYAYQKKETKHHMLLARLLRLGKLVEEHGSPEDLDNLITLALTLKPRDPAKPKNLFGYISQFAAKDDVRVNLECVWLVNSRLYASDGHTACSIPCSAAGLVASDEPKAFIPSKAGTVAPAENAGTPPDFEWLFREKTKNLVDCVETGNERMLGETHAVELNAGGKLIHVDSKYLKRAKNLPAKAAPLVRLQYQHWAGVVADSEDGVTVLIMPLSTP